MKYEAVFGDQSLFDGAPSDSTHTTKGGGFYRVTEDGGVQYLSRGPLNGNMCKCIGGHLIAERRIIPEPKRWTLEDKKAGRLPEVGSKAVSVHGFCVVDILAVRNGCVVACNSDVMDSRPCVFTIDNFLELYKPIETPEEKAQREEDDFISSLSSVDIHDGTVSGFFNQGARAAYRKLKGGE